MKIADKMTQQLKAPANCSRGPGFNDRHQYGVSPPSVAPVPGPPMLFSGLPGSHGAQTYM